MTIAQKSKEIRVGMKDGNCSVYPANNLNRISSHKNNVRICKSSFFYVYAGTDEIVLQYHSSPMIIYQRVKA